MYVCSTRHPLSLHGFGCRVVVLVIVLLLLGVVVAFVVAVAVAVAVRCGVVLNGLWW